MMDYDWEMQERKYEYDMAAIDLEAENAELRELYSELFDFLMSKNRELRTENTKLRELVKSAWKCVHTDVSCSDCRLIAGGCTLQSAIRELGMEVD